METILAAGHIPSAMEQFAPGDETAWDKIKRYITGSDAFILILGGRYGSIEPTTGKSYLHREYEYAMHLKKPYMFLVVDDKHQEERVREHGFLVDEREHRERYVAFRKQLLLAHCRMWKDIKDIQNAILHKLPEWAQRDDLKGWIRLEESPGPELAGELARLSKENHSLREQLRQSSGTFDGLSFEEFVTVLKKDLLDLKTARHDPDDLYLHAGHVFEDLHNLLAVQLRVKKMGGRAQIDERLSKLISHGLAVQSEDAAGFATFVLTDTGRRFRNRLLLYGDKAARLEGIW